MTQQIEPVLQLPDAAGELPVAVALPSITRSASATRLMAWLMAWPLGESMGTPRAGMKPPYTPMA